MFESVDKPRSIDKAAYQLREKELREQLLAAQYEILRSAKFSVVVLINGVDGAGKGETVSLLTEWMDPRHIRAEAFTTASDEELERPPMWRFWRQLPPSGKTAVFFGSWYTDPILNLATKSASQEQFQDALAEIQRFERMLGNEGVLLVKFWFHLSKKAQHKRLKELSKDKRTAWRVTPDEWERYKSYSRFRKASELALGATDRPEAPWILVNGEDPRHRSLTVGNALLSAMQHQLRRYALNEEKAQAAKALAAASPEKKTEEDQNLGDRIPVLRNVDLSFRLPKEDYQSELDRWQRKLALLTRHKNFGVLSPLIVFEGMDAAGKGGAIRRLVAALDPRLYTIIAVAAPTDEERARPYLWRFWRHAPRDGKFAIFDRSWYGRVLVERIEHFCSEDAWMRAYDEINDFESQLHKAGNVMLKFWLHVSLDEQLRRFKEREEIAFKRFKITDEDWRNRDKWPHYERAASEMIQRTSSSIAPWTIVEAEDKYWARVKVLKTTCEAIEARL